jgi:hypothetical protein
MAALCLFRTRTTAMKDARMDDISSVSADMLATGNVGY